MKQIAQGAEAKIYLEKEVIVKHRFPKSYRHPILDGKLRKFRTRRESKILRKLKQLNFPVPFVIEEDDKDMRISMEFIEGKKLRDVLTKKTLTKYCKQLGKDIALLHAHDIIHGDLTTSNMIVKKDKIFFIDFGLSQVSKKIEDKAVDLHLMQQALESKHYKIWEEAFKTIISSYKSSFDAKDILERFKVVESRGRNKENY